MSAIESILEAYCIELDEVINIEEAHDAFFSQNEPRKRFNFLCSDEQCRLLDIPPKITAVNYGSNFFERKPHFRRNNNYKHSENCIWGYYNKILNEVIKNKHKYKHISDKNIFLDFENIQSYDVFDEFVVRSISGNKRNIHNKIMKNSNDSIKDFIINHRKKTYRIAALVDIYNKMTNEEKKLAQIIVPENNKSSYWEAFRCVAFARINCTRKHIYHGWAKIYKYSKQIEGYGIFFLTKKCCYKFNKDENFPVRSFLEISSLDSIKYKSHIISMFDEHSNSGKAVDAYIFGEAHLQNEEYFGGNRNEFVSIVADSPRGIVLKSIDPQ